MIAYRGVVTDDGDIWAWPTILMDHNAAFREFDYLKEYRARWRQWSPGEEISFDPGVSPEDRKRVEEWVKVASALSKAPVVS